jgi:hypothetical protein
MPALVRIGGTSTQAQFRRSIFRACIKTDLLGRVSLGAESTANSLLSEREFVGRFGFVLLGWLVGLLVAVGTVAEVIQVHSITGSLWIGDDIGRRGTLALLLSGVASRWGSGFTFAGRFITRHGRFLDLWLFCGLFLRSLRLRF